ncbi:MULTISPECIES: hypothetical protein [unclassified Desulfovibrio]|uniref:hypothetical protein n=1 Tax=unclassified Desulfovibrio TaxID=2593640 RepID=UPI0013EB8BE7|nr:MULTISPECIES: hypothetical protein [unclassified Desulfovibrio]
MPKDTQGSVTTSLPTPEEDIQSGLGFLKHEKREYIRQREKSLGVIVPGASEGFAACFGRAEAKEALRRSGVPRSVWNEVITRFFPDSPARDPSPASTDD